MIFYTGGKKLKVILQITLIISIAIAIGCEPVIRDTKIEAAKVDNELKPHWKPYTKSTPWTDLRQHTNFIQPANALYPDGTADGKYIVYASTQTTKTPEIFIRSVEDTAPTQLTFSDANNLYPRISPNGSMIAFASDVEGDYNLYVIRRDNPTGVMQVTFSQNNDIAPSWSPDAKKLIYCSKSMVTENWGLMITDVATGSITILGPGLYPDWSSQKDADKRSIVFQLPKRDEKGDSMIMVVRPDGTELVEVVVDNNLYLANPMPRWSPDGKWIVFSAAQSSNKQSENLYLIRPNGTDLLRLTDEVGNQKQPSWCGSRILFVANKNNVNNIYSIKPFPLGLLEE